MSELKLRLRDVSVHYGAVSVLRGIDLDAPAGTLTVLLGGNGSGKSTLLRTALGLTPATGGEVRLLGRPLARFTQWSKIGYVPQRSGAAGGAPATVTEVVASGRLARRGLLRPFRRADRRQVEECLETVGLADKAKESAAVLSGGQQQRVLVARALATEPELLLMDEPTAGVDRHSQEVLAAVFAQLTAAGTAILMAAHELGPLGRTVDRAAAVVDGRIRPLSRSEALGESGSAEPCAVDHAEPIRPPALRGVA